MSLYATLLIAAVAVPLLLSFDKKLHFYTHWKYVFPAIMISALIYIIFDIDFTAREIWGFNEAFIAHISILGLPLEEIMFFLVIPYASLFAHYAFVLYFPQIKLPEVATTIVTVILLVFFAVIAILFFEKDYTFYIVVKSFVILLLMYFLSRKSLPAFYLTFLIILIPFVIVNGILTGSFLDSTIVWYNDAENLGLRVLTIPVEDFAYAFSMILLSLGLIDFAKRKEVFGK